MPPSGQSKALLKSKPKRIGGFIKPDGPDVYIKPKDRPRYRHYAHQMIVDPEGDANYVKWAADKGLMTRVDVRSLQGAVNPAVRQVARSYEHTSGIVNAMVDAKKSPSQGYTIVYADPPDLEEELLKAIRQKALASRNQIYTDKKAVADLMWEITEAAGQTDVNLIISALETVIPDLANFNYLSAARRQEIIAELQLRGYYIAMLQFGIDHSDSPYQWEINGRTATLVWLELPLDKLQQIVTGKFPGGKFEDNPEWSVASEVWNQAISNFIVENALDQYSALINTDWLLQQTDNMSIEERFQFLYSIMSGVSEYQQLLAERSRGIDDLDLPQLNEIPGWESFSELAQSVTQAILLLQRQWIVNPTELTKVNAIRNLEQGLVDADTIMFFAGLVTMGGDFLGKFRFGKDDGGGSGGGQWKIGDDFSNSSWSDGDTLPNADKATIPRPKIEDYELAKPGKKEAFEQLGYDVETTEGKAAATDEIMKEISEKVINVPARFEEVSNWGPRFSTEIEVTGPNGKQATLTVIWQYDTGTDVPRVITIIPEVHQ